MSARHPEHVQRERAAYLLGRGLSTAAVCRATGFSRPTVAAIAHALGQAPTSATDPRQFTQFALRLSKPDLTLLRKRAAAVGVSPAQFIERVVSCAARDDLYAAVTDGRFD